MGENQDIKSFGVVDYVVFAGMLAVSIIVGIYCAIKDRKNKTTDTYYFGGKNMSPIPVGLSISMTFLSALTIINFPTETYFFGMVLMWFTFCNFIPITVDCLLYIPIPLIHRLQISSIYEYLELRFNGGIRKCASLIGCFNMIFFMSMTIYIPALALNAVTPLHLQLTIILSSLMCTIYTTLGGMKAVVWTDTLQSLVMLAGALAVLIKGVIVVGGFQNIWDALERGGRLNMMRFDPNPTLRNSFWTIMIGTGVTLSAPNQAMMQRYLSCNSVKNARIAALSSILPQLIFKAIAVFMGAAMYAYFENCDPLKSGKIAKPDQMIPYMVVDMFQDTPGMAGLFVAAAFSGTMSTVSSGINSLATLIMEDFVIPRRPNLTQVAKVTISKIIVSAFGLLVTCIALSIQLINGTVIRILFSVIGVIGSPLLGYFTLGLFFPWTNATGAVIAHISSTLITGWIAVCSFVYKESAAGNMILPMSVDECSSASVTNSSEAVTSSTAQYFTGNISVSTIDPGNLTEESNWGYIPLYGLSFFYYGTFSLVVSIIVGIPASFITGANDPQKSDPALFMSMFSIPILPAKVQKFFRCGVPFSRSKTNSETEEKVSCGDSVFIEESNSTSSCIKIEKIQETDELVETTETNI